jgi:hypothetical protein
MNDLTVGSRVRIERDETRYPSKGTWPHFRGKTGTIVEINLGEYGVAFGKVWPRPDRPGVLRWSDSVVTWFQPHELKVLARAPQPALAASAAVTGVGVPVKALDYV